MPKRNEETAKSDAPLILGPGARALAAADPAKKAEGRRKALARRAALGIGTMSKAIKAKCLDCGGGQASEVTNCTLTDCPLWPFRKGRNPKERDLQVAQFNRLGNLTGHKPFGKED